MEQELHRKGSGSSAHSCAFGQRRVLLVWTRLIFPDGRSMVLERQPGADTAGHAGLEDRVDHHWANVLRAAGLSTLLAIGAELAVDEEDRLTRAIRDCLNRARWCFWGMKQPWQIHAPMLAEPAPSWHVSRRR